MTVVELSTIGMCRLYSSVATGGGAQGGQPPLPSTGMATGFVQIRGDFSLGGWG